MNLFSNSFLGVAAITDSGVGRDFISYNNKQRYSYNIAEITLIQCTLVWTIRTFKILSIGGWLLSIAFCKRNNKMIIYF